MGSPVPLNLFGFWQLKTTGRAKVQDHFIFLESSFGYDLPDSKTIMQIASVQILRAIAAICVVIGHAQAFIGFPMAKIGQSFNWSFLLPWGAGVDLFFVISGFIMVYSSERLFGAEDGTRQFLWRRLTRIVPLYWAFLLLILVKQFIGHKPTPDAAGIFASFIFMPWDSYGDGLVRPFYDLGWTLNYEMFFYCVFALFIGFRRELATAMVALVLGCLVVIALILPLPTIQLGYWSQPIILEFIFGMAIALLLRLGIVLPFWPRIALVVAGAILFQHDFLYSSSHPYGGTPQTGLLRVLAWGIPAAMVMAGCVLKTREALPDYALQVIISSNLFAKNRTHFFARCSGFAKLMGDASYALYLCHPAVMMVLSAVWFAAGLNIWLPAYLATGICVLTSIFASLLVHRWFEQPITRWLQSRHRGTNAKSALTVGNVSPP